MGSKSIDTWYELGMHVSGCLQLASFLVLENQHTFRWSEWSQYYIKIIIVV